MTSPLELRRFRLNLINLWCFETAQTPSTIGFVILGIDNKLYSLPTSGGRGICVMMMMMRLFDPVQMFHWLTHGVTALGMDDVRAFLTT